MLFGKAEVSLYIFFFLFFFLLLSLVVSGFSFLLGLEQLPKLGFQVGINVNQASFMSELEWNLEIFSRNFLWNSFFFSFDCNLNEFV